MSRVMTYIDGFNLYYGLREKNWQRYYWLDLHRLGLHLLRGDQELVHTHYFTSRISPGTSASSADKAKRQQTFLEAVATCPATSLYFGHYLHSEIRCKKCGNTWTKPEEKMTDVNVAVQLLRDAYADAWDTAILISGDSDLHAPIEAVHALFPTKRVVVAFPPARHSKKLESIAHASFMLGRKVLQDCQFPDEVRKPDGFILHRPDRWK